MKSLISFILVLILSSLYTEDEYISMLSQFILHFQNKETVPQLTSYEDLLEGKDFVPGNLDSSFPIPAILYHLDKDVCRVGYTVTKCKWFEGNAKVNCQHTLDREKDPSWDPFPDTSTIKDRIKTLAVATIDDPSSLVYSKRFLVFLFVTALQYLYVCVKWVVLFFTEIKNLFLVCFAIFDCKNTPFGDYVSHNSVIYYIYDEYTSGVHLKFIFNLYGFFCYLWWFVFSNHFVNKIVYYFVMTFILFVDLVTLTFIFTIVSLNYGPNPSTYYTFGSILGVASGLFLANFVVRKFLANVAYGFYFDYSPSVFRGGIDVKQTDTLGLLLKALQATKLATVPAVVFESAQPFSTMKHTPSMPKCCVTFTISDRIVGSGFAVTTKSGLPGFCTCNHVAQLLFDNLKTSEVRVHGPKGSALLTDFVVMFPKVVGETCVLKVPAAIFSVIACRPYSLSKIRCPQPGPIRVYFSDAQSQSTTPSYLFSEGHIKYPETATASMGLYVSHSASTMPGCSGSPIFKGSDIVAIHIGCVDSQNFAENLFITFKNYVYPMSKLKADTRKDKTSVSTKVLLESNLADYMSTPSLVELVDDQTKAEIKADLEAERQYELALATDDFMRARINQEYFERSDDIDLIDDYRDLQNYSDEMMAFGAVSEETARALDEGIFARRRSTVEKALSSKGSKNFNREVNLSVNLPAPVPVVAPIVELPSSAIPVEPSIHIANELASSPINQPTGDIAPQTPVESSPSLVAGTPGQSMTSRLLHVAARLDSSSVGATSTVAKAIDERRRRPLVPVSQESESLSSETFVRKPRLPKTNVTFESDSEPLVERNFQQGRLSRTEKTQNSSSKDTSSATPKGILKTRTSKPYSILPKPRDPRQTSTSTSDTQKMAPPSSATTEVCDKEQLSKTITMNSNSITELDKAIAALQKVQNMESESQNMITRRKVLATSNKELRSRLAGLSAQPNLQPKAS